MSGYEALNIQAFIVASNKLHQAGFEAVNPAPYAMISWTWADYLKRDIPLLLECDGVATLDDWQCSKGASLEVHIAQQLGMPVKPVRVWCGQ